MSVSPTQNYIFERIRRVVFSFQLLYHLQKPKKSVFISILGNLLNELKQ